HPQNRHLLILIKWPQIFRDELAISIERKEKSPDRIPQRPNIMVPRDANLRRWKFDHEIPRRRKLPPFRPLREIATVHNDIRPRRDDVPDHRLGHRGLIAAEMNVGDVGEGFQAAKAYRGNARDKNSRSAKLNESRHSLQKK